MNLAVIHVGDEQLVVAARSHAEEEVMLAGDAFASELVQHLELRREREHALGHVGARSLASMRYGSTNVTIQCDHTIKRTSHLKSPVATRRDALKIY